MIVSLDDGENRRWLHRLRGVAKAVSTTTTGLARPGGEGAVTSPTRIRVAKPILRGGKMYIQHYWITPRKRPDAALRAQHAAPAPARAPRWRRSEDDLARTLRSAGGSRALAEVGLDEKLADRIVRAWRDAPDSPLAQRLVREATCAFTSAPTISLVAKIARLARASLAGRSLVFYRGVRGEAARRLLAGARRVSMEPVTSLTRDRAVAQSFAGAAGAVLTLQPPRASVLLTDLAFSALDDLQEVAVVTRGPVSALAVEPGATTLTAREPGASPAPRLVLAS